MLTQAEELLKEAAVTFEDAKEQIVHLQDMCTINDLPSTGVVNKGIDTLVEKINAYLKSQESSVVNEGVISWEQAKHKVATAHKFENWDSMIRVILTRSAAEFVQLDLTDMETEAAHLFMEANRQQRWIPVEEKPEFGKDVNAVIEHWESKNRRVTVLKRVNEDDCSWRTSDDNSELSYDWNVILWQPLPEIPKEFKG